MVCGDFMKKFLYLLLASALLIFLCSCDAKLTKEYPKPVIVLPDEETASNVNGYKTEIDNSKDEPSSSADNSSETSANEKYIGNKSTKKYHTTDCRYAKNMKEENMIIFNDFYEVEASGYSSCSVCGK